MAWPLSQDYNEAIQDPASSFTDPELRAGEATTNALGMPMPRSGNFADVYEFNTPATNSKWAIKCFTRHVPGLRERYTEISAGLLGAKLPFAVDFQYLVQGIRVRGDWFPILKMRWVEGFLLNEFVRDNLDKPALLGNLGLIWARMAKRLREASIAHADLQHGNVILVQGSKASSLAVKLIDYDGMFVPALASKKSGEVGHPNYQHPQRLREGIYSAEVDRFPLLVVATALRALSVGGRELWDRYDNSDNLLFRESDLQAPGKSALFNELHNLADPQARMLVEELHKAAERNLDEVPRIDDLLPDAKTKAASAVAPGQPPIVPKRVEAAVENAAETTAPLDFEEDHAAKKTPRATTAKGGVPTWAWLAGGGVLAALVVGVIGVAVVMMVFLGGDPNKVAQGKENLVKDNPPKDGKKKVPGGVGPVVPPPLAKRFPATVPANTQAKWRVDGNELVQDAIVPDVSVFFGDPNWTDYDFSVDANLMQNTHGFALWFRGVDDQNASIFALGAHGNTVHLLDAMNGGKWGTSQRQPLQNEPLKTGRWYAAKVSIRGNAGSSFLDGVKVFDFKVDRRAGGVGLRTWDAACRFKNLRVTAPDGTVLLEGLPELTPEPLAVTAGFVPLFNGKDLEGWKINAPAPGYWRVENGHLVGTGPNFGDLFTARDDYRDFHLRIEMRVNAGAVNLVWVRAPEEPRPGQPRDGLAAHISTSQLDQGRTGALQLFKAPLKPQQILNQAGAIAADEWFTLEFIAQGEVITVKIDGKTTAAGAITANFKALTVGRIILAGAVPATRMEFRKIEIKELPAAPVPVVGDPKIPAPGDPKTPQLLVELKGPEHNAVLSADGRRIAYVKEPSGSFYYREGPAFDVEKKVTIEPKTRMEPSTSSLDGKKMTFGTRLLDNSKDGSPKVTVWNWETMQVEAEFPTPQQVNTAVFSPDMKWMVVRTLGAVENNKVLETVRLFDMTTLKETGSWQMDRPGNTVGFTPDSSKVFYQGYAAESCQAYSVKGLAPSTLNLSKSRGIYRHSPDFSRVVRIDLDATTLEVAMFDPFRPQRTLRTPREQMRILGVAISPDNRFLLTGVQDLAKAPDEISEARLIDLNNGVTLGVIEGPGQIGTVQVASNGIVFLQGSKVKPSLYRFPARPGAVVVKNDPPPGDFVPLFNGKDLAGLRTHLRVPGTWSVANGLLVCTGGDSDYLYAPHRDYMDFHLRLEARVSKGAVCEVNFRNEYDSAKSRPGEAPFTGYRAILASEYVASGKIGTIHSWELNNMPMTTNSDVGPIPADEWITLEVIAIGNRITTKVNGKTAAAYVEPKKRYETGHIFFRQVLNGAHVEFRKIEIKELNRAPRSPVIAADGFVPLFNGTDLTGWQKHPKTPGDWTVIDGVLKSKSVNTGVLLSNRADYKDFHLRLEARMKPDGEGGVFFRNTLTYQGYEAHFYKGATGTITVRLNDPDKTTSSLYHVGTPLKVTPTGWSKIEIIAQGKRVRLKIDGKTTTDYVDTKNDLRSGFIGLRDHRGSAEYRNIEIKELTTGTAPPVVPVADGFVPLFNGKDLTGWNVDKDSAPWHADKGVLTADAGGGIVQTTRADFKEFHLRLEARINDAGAAGGILIRQTPTGHGCEITVNTKNAGVIMAKGKSFTQNNGTGIGLPVGAWAVIDIIVQPERFTAKINGKLIAVYVGGRDDFPIGWIGLRHPAKGSIEFRKIEIKEVGAAPPIVVKEDPPKIKEDPPAKTVRLAVPDADKVMQAEKTIRDQFKKEYAKKTNAELVALAEKLLQLSKDVGDNPTDSYALLREARSLATKGASVEVAMKAAVEMIGRYEVDESATKVDTLVALSKAPLNAESTKQLVEAALSHARGALAEDHFETAAKVVAAAEAALSRNKNAVLLAQVQKQDKQIKDIAKDHGEMKKAQEKLQTDAKDAAANLIVGSYLAFRKGEWDKGLPLLAISGQADLQELAKKDLAAPEEDRTRIELADGWWNGADKKPAPPAHQKLAMQWRAAHWYRLALPTLTGLAQTRATERIKQTESQPAPFRIAGSVSEVDRFRGHNGSVNWLSLSADGKRLHSGGADGTVREWFLASGKSRVVLGQQVTKGPVVSFAVSPDERSFAFLNPNGKLNTFDLNSAKSGIGDHEAVPGFYWSGNTKVVFAHQQSWHTWTPSKGSSSGGGIVFGGAKVEANVRALVMAPEQNFGAVLCSDATTIAFRMQDGGLRLAIASIPFDATAAALPKDGKFIALGGKAGKLRSFSLRGTVNEAAKEIAVFTGHSGTIRALACTTDGLRIVSGGDDKTARVWDAGSGKELQRFPHTGTVTAILVTPDNRYVITASADSIIRVWSLSKATQPTSVPAP